MNEAVALHAAALAAAAEAADSLMCSLMAPALVTVLQSDSAGCTALDVWVQCNGRSLVAKINTVTGTDCMLEMCVCVYNFSCCVLIAGQTCMYFAWRLADEPHIWSQTRVYKMCGSQTGCVTACIREWDCMYVGV